jgi:hypothetical protein
MNKPTPGRVVATLVVACGLWSLGCATAGESFLAAAIAPQAGDPVMAGGLVIHASEDRELSSRSSGVVQVVLENRSPSWVRLANLTLDFGSPERNQAVHVPTGAELTEWQRALATRAHAQAADTDAALAFVGLLGLFGAIAGIATDTPGLAFAGDLALETSAAALDVRQHQRMADALERPPMLPETHLLAGAVSIPPGLAITRWVLIHTRTDARGVVTTVRLDYDTADGVRRAVRLAFRGDSCKSEWQRGLCAWRNTQ